MLASMRALLLLVVVAAFAAYAWQTAGGADNQWVYIADGVKVERSCWEAEHVDVGLGGPMPVGCMAVFD